MSSTSTARKCLFAVLIIASLVTTLTVITAFWYVAGHHLYPYFRVLLIIGAMLAVDLLLITAVSAAVIALFLWKGRTMPCLNNAASMGINLLFPLALQAGRLLGINEDAIKRSFITINNKLVEMKDIRIEPKDLLVLVPHCLQYHDCPHKITRKIHNCKKCGQCQVAKFLDLKDKHNINVAVATGGTLARKHLKDFNPKAVVAIACERDLTSGILDSYPMPVFGILNQRPHGPCEDTVVEMDSVLSSIRNFIGNE